MYQEVVDFAKTRLMLACLHDFKFHLLCQYTNLAFPFWCVSEKHVTCDNYGWLAHVPLSIVIMEGGSS